MKITICGSITNAKKIYDIKGKLEQSGHIIYSHELMKKYAENDEETIKEVKKNHSQLKIKNNTFLWYYEKIKESDAILVCNFEKNNIPGYIGGSALMEIGHAYVLNKKIFFLYPIPKISYEDELKAVQPTIINGDISKII